MALEATHVRFALDLLPCLHVSDIESYCAGAVYPDTRIATGLPREMTHGPRCPHDPSAEGFSDFQKGWAAHLLYDEIAGDELRKLLSEEFDRTIRERKSFIEFTSMKAVEDIQSVNLVPNVLDHLQRLAIDRAPLGESLERIYYHFSVTRKLYENIPSHESYRQWYLDVGVAQEVADGLFQRTQQMVKDQELDSAIRAIYGQTLEKVKKSLAI
ncbi:MAG: hypothetical protein WCT28_01615 [Patescibacteria group bacterium]|jgi:hypothetical protein